jgi:hypothetical protein
MATIGCRNVQQAMLHTTTNLHICIRTGWSLLRRQLCVWFSIELSLVLCQLQDLSLSLSVSLCLSLSLGSSNYVITATATVSRLNSRTPLQASPAAAVLLFATKHTAACLCVCSRHNKLQQIAHFPLHWKVSKINGKFCPRDI